MTSGPTIVKLGGSALTRKREAPRIRRKVLEQLARQLVGPGLPPLILLHGAGSFGHPGALRFGLASPPMAGKEVNRARGASIVSAEVRRLHVDVLKAIVDAGGRPWSLPAGTLASNHSGRMARLDVGPFRDALGAGVLPVSFGDVVLDEDWGFSILSADTIAIALARDLNARRVLFVSDVAGILEETPDHRRRVTPEVTVELVQRLTAKSGTPDVTGGIRGKALAMLEIARNGVDAGLISGLTDGALSRALRGDFVYGSWARTRPG